MTHTPAHLRRLLRTASARRIYLPGLLNILSIAAAPAGIPASTFCKNTVRAMRKNWDGHLHQTGRTLHARPSLHALLQASPDESAAMLRVLRGCRAAGLVPCQIAALIWSSKPGGILRPVLGHLVWCTAFADDISLLTPLVELGLLAHAQVSAPPCVRKQDHYTLTPRGRAVLLGQWGRSAAPATAPASE